MEIQVIAGEGNPNTLAIDTLSKLSHYIAADTEREHAALQTHVGESFRPTYRYLPQHAGRLAVGEAVIEPNLGSLRMAGTTREAESVHIAWADDYGPCRPIGRYALDAIVALRVPGSHDEHTIRQHVAQEQRHGRTIPASAARLIAVHMHTGPSSALYGFAIDGALRDERVYDELDQLQAARAKFRPWINALTRYCLSRVDPGPLPGWSIGDMEHLASQMVTATPKRKHAKNTAERHLFTGKTIPTDFVVDLMDAAFYIGLKAASTKLFKRPTAFDAYTMRQHPVWRALAQQQETVKQEWV